MSGTLTGDIHRAAPRKPRRGATYAVADRLAAARRHLLYLRVRSHVAAGWDALPDGLSATDIRDLAAMACSRRDRTIQSLCRIQSATDGPPPRGGAEAVTDACAL